VDKNHINFIFGQIKQIRKGGLSILVRKIGVILLIILAAPIVLLVRMLRPLVIIRFGPLMSERIGHFAGCPEVYLCEREAGMYGRSRSIDIFYYSSVICNQQLKRMWGRILHVCSFVGPIDKANRYLPGGKKHMIPWRARLDRDIYGLLAQTKSHLSFTSQEEDLGRSALQKLGINNSFICFYARDPAYLNAVFQDKDWNYHSYRNSTIHNYIPAAEKMVSKGYDVIRMGSIVKEALKVANPKIIDYATTSRTDFLDVYLGAKCQFFICDTAGIFLIPMVFRRPIAWVNFVPLEDLPTYGPNNLLIPKKLWLRDEHRFLTFREILNSNVGGFWSSIQYERLRIEVIENTQEEITALVVEMDERLKGKWQTTEKDEELQRRFWSLFTPVNSKQVFASRIGTEFLRQNQELLK